MAASITDSLAGLVAFGATVTGINASYDWKGYFDALANSTLATPPIAVAKPELGQQTGWQTLSMQGNSPSIQFNLEQYLFFSEVGDQPDITMVLPNEIALIDNYHAALKALPLLRATSNPATHQPVKSQWRYTRVNMGQKEYHGIVYVHALELYL